MLKDSLESGGIDEEFHAEQMAFVQARDVNPALGPCAVRSPYTRVSRWFVRLCKMCSHVCCSMGLCVCCHGMACVCHSTWASISVLPPALLIAPSSVCLTTACSQMHAFHVTPTVCALPPPPLIGVARHVPCFPPPCFPQRPSHLPQCPVAVIARHARTST
jgi:hypothetical protein